MKKFIIAKTLTIGAIALSLGAFNAECAPPPNGWVVLGNTQYGGQIIVGSGGGDVGQLSLFTSPTATSPNGGDSVSLLEHTTADGSNSFGATIEFAGSNNSLLNNGTIIAPFFDAGSAFSNTAVGFFSVTGLSNEHITNNSFIQGGFGDADNEFANSGISLVSFDGITNIHIVNQGYISGGGEGTGGGAATMGNAVVLFDDNGLLDINNVNFLNTGAIYGGSLVNDAFIAGNGVAMMSFGNVTNIIFDNTLTGVIKGGDSNQDAFVLGNGVVIMANPDGNSPDALINVNFLNDGKILGGNDAQIVNGANESGYVLGSGVVLWGGNGVYNVNFVNNGLITGGANSFDDSEEILQIGGVTGSALAIFDANQSLQQPGDINHISITNSGQMVGGDNAGSAYISGAGIGIVGLGNVLNVTINNTGFIIGGGNGSGFDNFPGTAVLGSGIGIAAGVPGTGEQLISQNFIVANVTINNAGTIQGGDNNGGADIVSSAIGIWGANGVYNTTINNSVTGKILGGTDSGNGDIVTTGIGIYDNNQLLLQDINGVAIRNAGIIIGGSDSGGATMAADGIGIVGNGNILNVNIQNLVTGRIQGGVDSGEVDTAVGTAIGIETEDNFAGFGIIRNVTIGNAGNIQGGNDNGGGDIVGTGIGIMSANGIYNVGITNGGNIFGGSNNEGGTIVGTAIGLFDGNNRNDINGVTIQNAGAIKGGNGNFDAELLGVGVGIVGVFNVKNITITNSGLIAGGHGNGFGDFVSTGIAIDSFNGTTNNVLITNYMGGKILGGTGYPGNVESSSDEHGGDGIDLGGVVVTNALIANNGLIAGGNGVTSLSGGEGGGNGGDGGDAIDIFAESGAINVAVINGFNGVIVGGNGANAAGEGPSAGFGGDGIFIGVGGEVPGFASNLNILNFGLIKGGNAGAGGFAGMGIEAFTNNLTINNWGTIMAGTGLSQANVAGFPAPAISVNGSNNTINLNGHSSVYGTIEGSNGVNNTLNLNFTGVNAAEAASLLQQLVAQGYPANNFQGSFTFRGVTYYIDPLKLNLNLKSYQTQGITPNQKSVGANLDSFAVNPTGDMLKLLNAIDATNVPLALEQLSPQKYQLYRDIAQAQVNFQSLEIDHRLNNLRDGSESIDTTGMGGNTDKTSAGFAKDGKDNKSVVVPDKAQEKRWGFFGSGSGLFGDVDARQGDLSDASFTTAGVLMGVDGKINDQFVAGLLFDYSHTQADLDSQGSTADIDTYGGGVYSGYHNGPWYGNGLLSYSHNSYDSVRTIVFPGINRNARGSTDGNQFGANLDGGYDFHLNDNWTVGPIVGLQYVHLSVDGFNEGGAGAANLAVGDQEMDSLRSRLGFRAEYKKQVKTGVAIAGEFRAAWQHEYLDDSRSIGGQFIGSGLSGFNVKTTKPERDAALVGVGINATFRDKWTVFVDYDVQAGQQSYLEQSVKGGLKVSF